MRVARVVLATSLAVCCAVTAAPEARAGGTNQARAEGIKLYNAGHYQEALALFRPGTGPPWPRSRES